MSKYSNSLVVALLLSSAPVGPARAQIPVIDASAITQLVEQVNNGLQQLQALQSQLAEVQSLVTSVTGAKGMDAIASLLNSSTVRSILPAETAQLLGTVGTAIDAYGTLSAAAQSIRDAGKITTYPGNDWYLQEMARRGNRHAIELATARRIFDVSTTRRSALDELRTRLSTVADTASALQLHARISVEVAQGINDLQSAQSLLLQQAANRSTDQQRQEEAGAAAVEDLRTRMNSPGSWWK